MALLSLSVYFLGFDLTATPLSMKGNSVSKPMQQAAADGQAPTVEGKKVHPAADLLSSSSDEKQHEENRVSSEQAQTSTTSESDLANNTAHDRSEKGQSTVTRLGERNTANTISETDRSAKKNRVTSDEPKKRTLTRKQTAGNTNTATEAVIRDQASRDQRTTNKELQTSNASKQQGRTNLAPTPGNLQQGQASDLKPQTSNRGLQTPELNLREQERGPGKKRIVHNDLPPDAIAQSTPVNTPDENNQLNIAPITQSPVLHEQSLASEDQLPAVTDSTASSTSEEETEATPTSPKAPELPQIVPSRWSIALSVSPDFSRTLQSGFYEPGAYFGMMLGYQVSPRFMITTGLMTTTKNYKGKGSEYSPPPGSWQKWTNGIKPDHVTANCGLRELPVIIQYTVQQRPKSRMFVSVGVSSYFMRHEDYKFSFDAPNPGAADGWKTKKPSQYLFSVGHLSLGVERQLSSHVAVGIEPFLKVPLAGIGWYKVNLYTTGAFVNLRYRILKTTR
jgi:hypothetical protein